MKNIFKTNKRGIIAILALCMLLNTIGICVHADTMPEENSAVTEETTVVVEETVVATEEPIIVTEENVVVTNENAQELIPMMARGCGYDYNTVIDCMRDISSTYGFTYSPIGNGYTCSGGYSVSIEKRMSMLGVKDVFVRSANKVEVLQNLSDVLREKAKNEGMEIDEEEEMNKKQEELLGGFDIKR